MIQTASIMGFVTLFREDYTAVPAEAMKPSRRPSRAAPKQGQVSRYARSSVASHDSRRAIRHDTSISNAGLKLASLTS
jgi:hypothetical protein